ncbi:hypothetical protein SAMN05443252_1091 [Bacillus sp. OV322]|nr:hypothetical protein SAMN05443252_1091 [Bacillus sp. OV322]
MKIMNVVWVLLIVIGIMLSGCSEGPQIDHFKEKIVEATVVKKEYVRDDVSEWELTLRYKDNVIVYGYDHSDYYNQIKEGDKVPVTLRKGYTKENKLEAETIEPVNE